MATLATCTMCGKEFKASYGGCPHCGAVCTPSGETAVAIPPVPEKYPSNLLHACRGFGVLSLYLGVMSAAWLAVFFYGMEQGRGVQENFLNRSMIYGVIALLAGVARYYCVKSRYEVIWLAWLAIPLTLIIFDIVAVVIAIYTGIRVAQKDVRAYLNYMDPNKVSS